jgi:hydrogenase maturation protease
MSETRTLVGGIGNIFLGDDAFGVEVANRLAARPLPPGVRVVDFGIRGIDLAYALLENFHQVILVDAVRRGGKPGTLYIIEPLLEKAEGMETHEMSPSKALAAAKGMGATLKNVIIIGCEPESFGSDDEPQMGLSRAIEGAVDEAITLIEAMVKRHLPVAQVEAPI